MDLEGPLEGEGRVDEGVAVADGVGIEDEVVTDLHFGADAQVYVFETFEGVEVVPELGLGEDDELAVAVGFLAATEVDVA